MGNRGEKRHVLSTCAHEVDIALRIVNTVTVLKVGRGRPNVTGRWQSKPISGGGVSGAITAIAQGNGSYANDGIGPVTFEFDASNSNSIYTDSGKVYPLSLALNFIIKT